MARHSTMVCQVCRLQPHPQTPITSLAISAEMIWREEGFLGLSYGLLPTGTGAMVPLSQQLVGPWGSGTVSGVRRDLLWEHTCFEAFLGLPDQKDYWELNVSPSGDWNLYRFSGYRENGVPEPAIPAPVVRVQPSAFGLRCSVHVDLRQFWPRSVVPHIGLTMVVEELGGALSYWALSHPGDEADFHDRRGFLIP